MINGFINFYKPPNITSNKALGILKHHLKQNSISTKIGHFGTLDPIAEGVLPIALGRATRLFNYSLDKIKEYIADFEFGISTDTLDTTGKIIKRSESFPTAPEIEKVLPKFLGEIEQVPPNYSAKSVNGVRAYKLARMESDFILPPKKVIIYQFELLKENSESNFTFKIRCGGGTYIRALARDLGEKLCTFACMSKLLRSVSGVFNVDSAVKLEIIENSADINQFILPMDTVLNTMDTYYVDKQYEKKLLNGVPLFFKDLPVENFAVFLENKGLIGIAQKNEENMLSIKTWLL